MTIEAIIWYLFLIDAVGANLIAFLGQKWWKKSKWSKIIPMSRLWTLLYLGLVIWVGSALNRAGCVVW